MIREEAQFLVCNVRKIHNLRLLLAPASTTGLSSEEIYGDYKEVTVTGAIHLRN